MLFHTQAILVLALSPLAAFAGPIPSYRQSGSNWPQPQSQPQPQRQQQQQPPPRVHVLVENDNREYHPELTDSPAHVLRQPRPLPTLYLMSLGRDSDSDPEPPRESRPEAPASIPESWRAGRIHQFHREPEPATERSIRCISRPFAVVLLVFALFFVLCRISVPTFRDGRDMISRKERAIRLDGEERKLYASKTEKQPTTSAEEASNPAGVVGKS